MIIYPDSWQLLGKSIYFIGSLKSLCHFLTLDLLKVVNSEEKVNYGSWGI